MLTLPASWNLCRSQPFTNPKDIPRKIDWDEMVALSKFTVLDERLNVLNVGYILGVIFLNPFVFPISLYWVSVVDFVGFLPYLPLKRVSLLTTAFPKFMKVWGGYIIGTIYNGLDDVQGLIPDSLD